MIYRRLVINTWCTLLQAVKLGKKMSCILRTGTAYWNIVSTEQLQQSQRHSKLKDIFHTRSRHNYDSDLLNLKGFWLSGGGRYCVLVGLHPVLMVSWPAFTQTGTMTSVVTRNETKLVVVVTVKRLLKLTFSLWIGLTENPPQMFLNVESVY